MTWEILAALITIVGFGITVCTVVAKNASVMAKLQTTLDEFRRSVEADKVKSDRIHGNLERRVEGHETRIALLEDWRKMKED